MKILQKICFVLLLTTFSSVYGGSCFDGNNFDFETCKREAEQGHSDAQYNLGMIYASGDGVLQDNVMAHMYWNISAVSGHTGAIKNRGDVLQRTRCSSGLCYGTYVLEYCGSEWR